MNGLLCSSKSKKNVLILKDLQVQVSEKNRKILCGYVFYTGRHGGSSVFAHMHT